MTILWRIFRKNVCKPYLYFFLVTIWHNKTMCASFIFFWFFWISYAQLCSTVIGQNPSKPLSKPLKTPHTTGSSIVVHGRLRSGARVSYSVQRSAWDALIGWRGGVWISLSRWSIRTVHLNPTARVDAVHGPSLRSALSIVACVPVPTHSMHAHPQNCARACMHGLDVALLRHPYGRSKLSHAYH